RGVRAHLRAPARGRRPQAQVAARARPPARPARGDHVRLAVCGEDGVLTASHSPRQSGQVLVLVAVGLLALIGSAALILLAGSIAWQKNQLQELADSTALDSALTIGISCNAAKANAVITEADTFLATRKTRTGALTITPGTCATPYKGVDTFAGGLSATFNYPYRAHQQQVEVILTLSLPISFGAQLGTSN